MVGPDVVVGVAAFIPGEVSTGENHYLAGTRHRYTLNPYASRGKNRSSVPRLLWSCDQLAPPLWLSHEPPLPSSTFWQGVDALIIALISGLNIVLGINQGAAEWPEVRRSHACTLI